MQMASKLFPLLSKPEPWSLQGLYTWLLWLRQGRKGLGGKSRLLLVKESKEGQPLLDTVFAL